MTSGTRALVGSRARNRSVTIAIAILLAVTSWLGPPGLAPASAQEGAGAIAGRVLDAASDAPIEGVRVIVTWPTPADDSEPREEVQVSDPDGAFSFPSIPAGSYTVEFVKPGYQGTTLRDFAVQAGQTQRADLRMTPAAAADEGPPEGVEEIFVLGARVEAIEASRQEADEMINTLSAEDISKYAASDVADVILRIPGVNVVEGQFAIIRGLEDRYTSTLFNSAVVPSPDPDRQSPQLDLFPAEVVTDLVVAKTFGPDLPSNSSGGSINVLTSDYPEEVEIKTKFKVGLNENAIDRFIRYDDHNPVGEETSGFENTYASEAGAFVGTRQLVFGREVRFKVLGNWDNDYDTAKGFAESQEPKRSDANFPGGLELGDLTLTAGHFDQTTSESEQQNTGFGAFGFDFDEAANHGVDFTLFWTHKTQEIVQLNENGYFPGLDYLQPDGAYERELNGDPVDFQDVFSGAEPSSPGVGTLSTWIGKTRPNSASAPNGGPLWFGSFMESKSFQAKRDLFIPQVNGHDSFDFLPGFELKWAGNWARTTQDEEAYGARMWFEPCGFSAAARFACPEGITRIPVPTQFPVTVDSLGPGFYAANNDLFINDNDIEETQWFGRVDGDYQTDLTDWLSVLFESGLWYEHVERDVGSSYMPSQVATPNPACRMALVCIGSNSSPAVIGQSLRGLGQDLIELAFPQDGSLRDPTVDSQSKGKREIQALNFGGKTTLFEDVDLLAGVRLEDIYLLSDNDPFQTLPNGSPRFDFDGSPYIFPRKWVLFDRYGDNNTREAFEAVPPFNDEVLGIRTGPGICRGDNPAQGVAPPPIAVEPGLCVDLTDRAEIERFIDGEIDEREYLPSVGIAYRPVEGLALRAAWSRTVARPSLREMGYYVSVEPASDDLIVGNPQLQLSEVESWDARVEYFYGDFGDLVAVSAFYKTVDTPIESIIVRNPVDFQADLSLGLFRTWFNNPNEAQLWGIELEARKNLGFVRSVPHLEWLGVQRMTFLDSEFVEFFSIGANFTWIEAEVDRTEAELARSRNFFPTGSGRAIETSRRLYGQPEWMVNADISFDHPDWGTKLTLAFFGISDVLDAAGAATIGTNGDIEALTLDRYIDSFHKLDLTFSQEIWRGLGFKFTAKNLTDSRRELVYDPVETSGKVAERSYKLGREYSFELNYTFDDLPFLGGE